MFFISYGDSHTDTHTVLRSPCDLYLDLSGDSHGLLTLSEQNKRDITL